MQNSSSRKNYDRERIADLAHQVGGPIPPPLHRCYECGIPDVYLFEDGRCAVCTRQTPEEVRGDIESSTDPDV